MDEMRVRSAEPGEYSEVYNLVDSAFKQSKLESRLIKVTACDDANFRKGDLRVVEVDGMIVSMVMIIRRSFRIGTAIVDGAMVAPLATHPDHEGKGCGSLLMREGVEYMKSQGLDAAILWGIPWLYQRYGI